VRDVLKLPNYWLIVFSGFVSAVGGYANFVNFQSIRLKEVGFSIEAAALYFGLSFVFTQVGRMLCTLGSDMIHPSIGYGLCRLTMAVGILSFAFASNAWWMWGYVIFYGIGYGYSIPASAVLYGGLFGRANFGKISGLSQAFGVVTGIPGPLLF